MDHRGGPLAYPAASSLREDAAARLGRTFLVSGGSVGCRPRHQPEQAGLSRIGRLRISTGPPGPNRALGCGRADARRARTPDDLSVRRRTDLDAEDRLERAPGRDPTGPQPGWSRSEIGGGGHTSAAQHVVARVGVPAPFGDLLPICWVYDAFTLLIRTQPASRRRADGSARRCCRVHSIAARAAGGTRSARRASGASRVPRAPGPGG